MMSLPPRHFARTRRLRRDVHYFRRYQARRARHFYLFFLLPRRRLSTDGSRCPPAV